MLTDKEITVLSLLAAGHNNETVGREMGYSKHSIKAYMRVILRKLEARNSAHAFAIAYRAGYLQ